MFNKKIVKVALATFVVGSALSQAAFAQGLSTLRDPLIPGARETPPIIPAPDGPLPPPGCGPTPFGVTPGMAGSPGFEPWVPFVPSNSLGPDGTSFVPLPVAPPIALPPGVLGPALTPFIPHEESTPGAAPPYVYVDGNNPSGLVAPESVVPVNQGGGLPGTGGYNTTISKVRRGGQQTHQWEERGLYSTLGGGGNSQDEVTEFGALAGLGVPFGVPSGNAYNKGPAGSNNDLRLSDIDLGGGMRMEVGGTKISTGSSLQDYGDSYMRNNTILGLTAHQSTEFGQGMRREPVTGSSTTDFGCRLQQANPLNVGYQKTGQLLNPNAVETNF
jgi:hypothetical protein